MLTEKQIQFLRQKLKDTTSIIVDNKVLDVIERGKLSEVGWQKFAKQRYLSALHFEELLGVIQSLAKSNNNEVLLDAIEENIRDEEGIDSDGNNLPTGSHDTWRRHFYHALGVTDEMLACSEYTFGTKKYDDTLEKLIREKDLFRCLGALLILEYSIPEEFKRIKIGRDLSFPEQFVVNLNDAREVRRKKGFAKMYIDHHIAHDANAHYPDLERAILLTINNEEELNSIISGMEIIAEAKKEFYSSLEHVL